MSPCSGSAHFPLTVDVMCESTFREEGNRLYVQGRIEEAEEKYKTAIGMLEQLMLRYGCILVNEQHFWFIYCLASEIKEIPSHSNRFT